MKEWTETEENTELLFENYEGVIYNVLKRINLTKKNPSCTKSSKALESKLLQFLQK